MIDYSEKTVGKKSHAGDMTWKPRMLAIDLDGTMLTDAKEITAGNLAAIRKASEAGCHVCIATGRAWPGARDFVRKLGCSVPVVTSNGAMIVNPTDEAILYDLELDAQDAREIYRLGEQIDVTQIVWTKNRLFGSRENELLLDYSRRFGKIPGRPVPSIGQLVEEGVSKILWYFPEEDSGKYLCAVPEKLTERVSVVTSSPHFLEFFNCGVSKAKAVAMVAERLGLDFSDVAAIGDAGNDIPMLAHAGLGVAMGNATEDVKEMADMITDDNEHDGVARLIDRFWP